MFRFRYDVLDQHFLSGGIVQIVKSGLDIGPCFPDVERMTTDCSEAILIFHAKLGMNVGIFASEVAI